MILIEDVILIHQTLIKQFGGIRDVALLESAIARPFQTFDGGELYKTVAEKSDALLQSLISNHPFYDGNKRTGYLTFRLYLLSQGLDLLTNESEKYSFVLSIAEGKIKYEEILFWIGEKIVTP
ncbi:type II toxin-antitoxin system death-on-curing family toxin [soil metagenome]